MHSPLLAKSAQFGWRSSHLKPDIKKIVLKVFEAFIQNQRQKNRLYAKQNFLIYDSSSHLWAFLVLLLVGVA